MPTTVDTFPVADGDTIRLQVNIGDAQEGGSAAVIAGKLVGKGDPIDTTIGADLARRGEVLVVSSNVKDRRPETNWTSVTLVLASGQRSRRYAQEEIAEPGGVVNYVFAITLT